MVTSLQNQSCTLVQFLRLRLLVLLMVVVGNNLISNSLVTGEEQQPDVGQQQQQITTITTSSSEPCMFNRFCTCVTENIQSVAPHIDSTGTLLDQTNTIESNSTTNTDDLLNSFNIDQNSNTIYSHSKLYEITCLNSPFYSVPRIPTGQLYRLNLIGAKQLSRIKSSSFIQNQISSITISRSKVQIIDNDAFSGSESTLTALDLSLNELTEFPSAALKRLPILQWLNLKGNRIEEIRASDIVVSSKESNSRYRARRSLDKHYHLSNRRVFRSTDDDQQYRAIHRRMRRQKEDELGSFVKTGDWILTKSKTDLKPDDQILLRRTARKRHYHSHARNRKQKHKARKIFKVTTNKINDRQTIDHHQTDLNNRSPKQNQFQSIEGYQNDDTAHQVLKEDTQDSQDYVNQTDQQINSESNQDHGVLSLRSLLLSDNYLTTITGQTFASLSSLDALDLDNNLIFKIEGKPFPVSLSSLSLANNLLENLPISSFKPLKQLKWLQLRGNMLKNLPEQWPFSTNQIEILDLSRNLISSLNGFFSHSNGPKQIRSKITLYTKNDDQSIKSQKSNNNSSQQLIVIKDLLLDNNLLRSLAEETFINCQIDRLVLSNNRLSTIVSNLFLNSPLSNSLKVLDLSNNQIEQLDDSFTGLKKLHSLFIRSNQLSQLNENVFKSCAETIQIVDLSGNQFTQVPYQSFESTKRLLKLNFQNNRIRILTKHDFQQWSKSLLSLQLNRNQIEQIDRDTFKYTTNLRELRLASNRLININPELFAPLGRKLSILELSGTQEHFDNSDQSDMRNNKQANLSASIKDGINKLKNIEFLELNHNALHKFTGESLASLSNLVHLDLEGNGLTEISGTLFNASKHTKLRNIILTDNKLNRIGSYSFANLRQVINIALIGNRLQKIETNAFVDLPQLSTILMTRNRLRNIRKSAFFSLKNLRNLFLQHNQLEELSLDMFNNSDLLVRNKMMLNDEQPKVISFNPLFSKLGSQTNQLTNNQTPTGLHLNASHNSIQQLNGLTRVKRSNSSSQITNEIETEDEYQLYMAVLDLSHNLLTKLNVQFFQIVGKNLIKLIVNNNRLTVFPLISLNQCPNLQMISLRNNRISNLIVDSSLFVTKEQMLDYSNLQYLDLAYNEISNLTSFRPILSTANKLSYLDLTGNRISTLLDHTFNGTSIQHLDLSANQLNDLPFTLDCYGLQGTIVSLILDSNQLSSLPKELNTCMNLNYLSIKNNQIAELGSQALAKLPNLLSLDLSGNTFYSIHSDAFDKLINLRKLFLSNCNLDQAPSLNDATELIELDLSQNSLTLAGFQASSTGSLSRMASIFKARKLKQLNLSSNLLTEVPRQLSKYLNSITELDLSFNPIELLDSSSLSELKNLRIIDIRGLHLKFVDSRVFHNHRHLTYIKTSTYPNVRSFRLYDLMAKMFSVRRALIHVEESVLSHQLQWAFGSKIKELTITGNNLVKILPDAFLGLYHTTDFVLRITKTSIIELPPGLLRYLTLTDLKYITVDLSDNKLTTLNRDVLFFGKDKEKISLYTGGLNIQKNQFNCDCNLLWLKDWYERWLKESRKAQLINHEHYLRNYQLLDQIVCTRTQNKSKDYQNDQKSSIKLDFLKFFPPRFEFQTIAIESNKTIDEEISIFKLNKDDLKCSNNAYSITLNAILLCLSIILTSLLTCTDDRMQSLIL